MDAPLGGAGLPTTPVAKRAATPDFEAWDDDLGWEGEEAPAEETREAWEQWRTTKSPLAAAAAEPDAEPEPEPEPELPSVGRWRAQAQDPEWFEDDDGLGWEGAQDDDTAPTGPALWNGDRQSAPSPSGNGSSHAADANGREWTRRTEGPAEPVGARVRRRGLGHRCRDHAPAAGRARPDGRARR